MASLTFTVAAPSVWEVAAITHSLARSIYEAEREIHRASESPLPPWGKAPIPLREHFVGIAARALSASRFGRPSWS